MQGTWVAKVEGVERGEVVVKNCRQGFVSHAEFFISLFGFLYRLFFLMTGPLTLSAAHGQASCKKLVYSLGSVSNYLSCFLFLGLRFLICQTKGLEAF